MKIEFFQVDAFTKKLFSGNPAAICLLESWIEDTVLQAIAAENNLSETAFLVQKTKDSYDMRWFTPKIEVDLCGHATLASAFVIFSFVNDNLLKIYFDTASGLLTVKKSSGLLSMDFPLRRAVKISTPDILSEAIGIVPSEVLKSRDLLLVLEDESDIRKINPDFEKLKLIKDVLGIIVTAPGNDSDFVSRFFAPNAGVNEDPVTGSAHSTLIPYWSDRLHKTKLHAYQLSHRGGELFCEYFEDHVVISGHAVLYAKGEIYF